MKSYAVFYKMSHETKQVTLWGPYGLIFFQVPARLRLSITTNCKCSLPFNGHCQSKDNWLEKSAKVNRKNKQVCFENRSLLNTQC